MNSVTLFLVLSLSDGTDTVRSQLLKTLSASLDPERVALKPRVLGNASHEVLEVIAQRQPLVEVQWVSTTQATVRAALKPGKWTTRVLTFAAADHLNERAKAIAFTIAAMMPDWRPPEPVPEPEVVPEVTALSENDLNDGQAETAPEVRAEPVAPASPVDVAPAPAPAAASFSGYAAVAGVGTLSHLTGGPGLEVGWCPRDFFCAGVSGALLFGALSDINTTRLDARLEGSLDLRWAPLWSSRFGLTARLAAGALFVSLQRGAQTRSRWAAVGGLEAGPLLRLGAFDLALAVGVRVTGETKVFIENVQAAEISNVLATGRFSLGWRF